MRSASAVPRFTVILASALLLSACGGGGSEADDAASTPAEESATTDPALLRADRRPFAERCDSKRMEAAEEVTFENADGVELWAAAMGSGPRGVVLVHGTGDVSLCNWSAVVPALADDGFHVLAVDHRCMGGSACEGEISDEALDLDVIAAVDELRSRGVRTVTVIGESRGGAVVLAAAARPDFEGDAVVLASAVWFDGVYSGPRPAHLLELVTRIQVPSLFVASRDDPHVTVPQYRKWAGSAPGSKTLIYDTAGHGAEMFGFPEVGPNYERDLVPFLRSVSQ